MNLKSGPFWMYRETSLKNLKPKISQKLTSLSDLKDQNPEQGLVPSRCRGMFDE